MAAESSLLTSNRGKLVGHIRLVAPFLDKLLENNQLTAEECDVVKSERTCQDRARALIDLVGTKGQEAFSHFRQVLKETNPELEDILHRCTDHNERIKLHCDDCVQLLCRKCSREGHRGHRLASIVSGANMIRREVTAFMRDNRKLLKRSSTSNDGEDRQDLLLDIEQRKNALKVMFNATIEEEYERCKSQLNKCASSPVASVSSIATTEGELSSSDGSEAEHARARQARRMRGKRAHPYSRVGRNYLSSKRQSPVNSVPIPAMEFENRHPVTASRTTSFSLTYVKPPLSPLVPSSLSPPVPMSDMAASSPPSYLQSDSDRLSFRSPYKPLQVSSIFSSYQNSPSPPKAKPPPIPSLQRNTLYLSKPPSVPGFYQPPRHLSHDSFLSRFTPPLPNPRRVSNSSSPLTISPPSVYTSPPHSPSSSDFADDSSDLSSDTDQPE